MVNSTNPNSLDKTHQITGCEKCIKDSETIKQWDKEYNERARLNPKVAICEVWKKHLYLNKPTELNDKNLNKIFTSGHGTMNPHTLTDIEWNKFQNWLNSAITKSNY